MTPEHHLAEEAHYNSLNGSKVKAIEAQATHYEKISTAAERAKTARQTYRANTWYGKAGSKLSSGAKWTAGGIGAAALLGGLFLASRSGKGTEQLRNQPAPALDDDIPSVPDVSGRPILGRYTERVVRGAGYNPAMLPPPPPGGDGASLMDGQPQPGGGALPGHN